MMKSPRKDHMHVYYENLKDREQLSPSMVPYHVDNGLFLLLTPAEEGQSALVVWQSDGSPASTENLSGRKDAVLVLMGRGVTEWLLQDDFAERSLFHAVPHSVPAMTRAGERIVYARMKVAPGKEVKAI